MTKDVAAHSPDTEDTVWGMPRAEYNAKAEREAKGNIALWLLAGLIFNLLTGKLFSLKSLFLVLPGVFVVAFAGIPFFYLSVKMKQKVQSLDNVDRLLVNMSGKHLPTSKQVPTLVVATIAQICDLIFPIIAAIIYASIV